MTRSFLSRMAYGSFSARNSKERCICICLSDLKKCTTQLCEEWAVYSPCSGYRGRLTCACSCRTPRQVWSPCTCGTLWQRQSSPLGVAGALACWLRHARSRPCNCCKAHRRLSCCDRSLQPACWCHTSGRPSILLSDSA